MTKLYAGLDAHKEQTSIALADKGPQDQVRHYGSNAASQIAAERTRLHNSIAQNGGAASTAC